MEAAGICGSDLHNYRTGQWISRRPSTAGHEFSGRIIAVGPGVEDLSVGDRVSADSRVWCGICPACTSGRTNICETLGFVGEVCDGGFAEQVVLPAGLSSDMIPSCLPPSPPWPSRLPSACTPCAGCQPIGEAVLIAGCGTIGGLAALLLSRLHDGPILLADLNVARAARVAEVSGGKIVALEKGSIAAALGEKGRLRYAIDATGSTAAIATLLALLSGGGALALVGISHGTLDLDPNILVEREIALLGCHAFETNCRKRSPSCRTGTETHRAVRNGKDAGRDPRCLYAPHHHRLALSEDDRGSDLGARRAGVTRSPK